MDYLESTVRREREREKGADWIGLKQGWQGIVTWPWSDIVALTYLSSVIRKITRQKKNMVNIGSNDNNCFLGRCIHHDSHTLKNDINVSVCNNTKKTEGNCSMTICVLQIVVHIFCLLPGLLLYASVFLKLGKLTFIMCAIFFFIALVLSENAKWDSPPPKIIF